jgi:hypothetical protein
VKYEGTLIAAASGKLAGVVFSHNASGKYVRQLAIPTNPATVQQEVIRATTAQLANLWVNSLTQAQRDEWTAYATAVPILDAIGNPVNIPPMAMYVRSNVARIQSGLARVDNAPAILDLGEFTVPSVAAPDATAETVDVTFTNGDAWANEDDSAMLVFASRGQNPTINYFTGPYRFAGRIDGDSVTPPTSPATISLPFAVVATQKVFFRFAVTRADGRYSYSFRTVGVAA